MKSNKVIVCHPAQQHSYRLAVALKRSGILFKYITTVYYKPRSLTAIIPKVLSGSFKKKAEDRHCDELQHEEVMQFCEFEGLLKLLALNIKWFRPFYNSIKYHTANRFAKKVAKYAIENNVDAVITYDDCSPILFEILQEKAPKIKRVMDMSAAYLPYMKSIYEKDMQISPDFSDKLYDERKILWNEKRMKKVKEEIELTQYFLVGSTFVKKSLMFSGIPENWIYICPYGVDLGKFAFSPKKVKANEPLKFIFVGGTKQMKGISYLLEAFREISTDLAVLTIVGVNNLPENLLRLYKEKIIFTGQLSHNDVAKELSKSDVMVFPSLGEGFSLSIIEAMSVGLPIIGTTNVGVNDYIHNHENGFVISIHDKQEIINKVFWFHENRYKIPEMSLNSRNTALSLTWDKYYENVSNVVKDILEMETRMQTRNSRTKLPI